MNIILAGAATVTAVTTIGAGALALDRMHVASEDFKEYIEQQQMADDREYVRKIKQDIREISIALRSSPDDPWLTEEMAALIDELCEIRPDDRMCDY